MKILFVSTALDISISDSARGYYGALKRQGHEVYYFNTAVRVVFNAMGLKAGPDPKLADDFSLTSRLASEGMVVEALRQRSDLVIVASGLGLHPDGLELLNRAGFPIALVMTESPYDDEKQDVYSQHAGHVFTNDRYSAKEFSWHYLGSAYDPEFHHPYPFQPANACDVLFVGTGWEERQKLLEGVDWSGINLKILGIWPNVEEGTPLFPFYEPNAVTNDETAQLYCCAKVCINHHRASMHAQSLNPRAYELGGCGAYQVSDWRPELEEVYGNTVPVYGDSAELEELIRAALATGRESYGAERQREKLLSGRHTFDDRAAELMAVVTGAAVAV